MHIYTPPIDSKLIRKLYSLWSQAFGENEDPDISVETLKNHGLEGEELNLFCVFQEEDLTATAVSIVSSNLPELGAVGEVATDLAYRNQGLASKVCGRLLDHFKHNNGKVLFLGTTNPNAARIYQRLGWNHIPKTTLMVNMVNGDDYHDHLRDYYKDLSLYQIRPANYKSRIPIIPLFITPNNWQVLDINVPMYSINDMPLSSCLGIYRRYNYIRRCGGGNWFTAETGDGKIIGISSCALIGEDSYLVDGFCHNDYPEVFKELLSTTLNWCRKQNARTTIMRLSDTDENKLNFVEDLGYPNPRIGPPLKHGEQNVNTLEYAIE